MENYQLTITPDTSQVQDYSAPATDTAAPLTVHIESLIGMGIPGVTAPGCDWYGKKENNAFGRLHRCNLHTNTYLMKEEKQYELQN